MSPSTPEGSFSTLAGGGCQAILFVKKITYIPPPHTPLEIEDWDLHFNEQLPRILPRLFNVTTVVLGKKMATIIKKKDPKSSQRELVAQINHFAYLLEEEEEDEAAKDLRIAGQDLQKYAVGSSEYQSALNLIYECFEGAHELKAYTFQRSSSQNAWTKADELFLASTGVLTLVKRLLRR